MKPLGYAMFERSGQNIRHLIFPRLAESFRMGVPAEAEAFNKYTTAVSKAIKILHQSRVVHVDLYPCNILWDRDVSGRIIVRIVDWDAATFIDEIFTSKMLCRRMTALTTVSFRDMLSQNATLGFSSSYPI